MTAQIEVAATLPTRHGGAPALLQVPDRGWPFRGTVLLYHGLGAQKEVQRQEAASVAAAGFLTVTVDAWGHGARRLDDFDSLVDGPDFGEWFVRMLTLSVEEIPDILDALTALVGTGLGRVAVAGISMGGCIAFGAAVQDGRVAAAVPILGSPDWRLGRDVYAPHSPHLRPQALPPCAVLACNAGLDEHVPAAPTRAFMEQLESHYQDLDRLCYVEYPESQHFMREADWYDVWDRALLWFDRFLGG